jgi:hypothetical protein
MYRPRSGAPPLIGIKTLILHLRFRCAPGARSAPLGTRGRTNYDSSVKDIRRLLAGYHFGADSQRGLDMVMLTSDLACMIARARVQLDDLRSKTA